MTGVGSTKRVYIAFQAADLAEINEHCLPGDIVFGDVARQEPGAVRHVRPELPTAELLTLLGQTVALFEELKDRFGPSIGGFINLFFEASILPIATYANALTRLLRELGAPSDTEVVFPGRIRLPQYGSTYFLAEHEVQTRFLYRRNQVFQPYLEDVCRAHGVRFTHLDRSEVSFLALVLVVRRYTTFLVRFAVALGKSAMAWPAAHRAPPRTCDIIVVSRSPNKSEFVFPLLTLPSLRSSLIVGETFMSFRRNALFCEALYRDTAVSVAGLQMPGPVAVCAAYGRAWRAQSFADKRFRFDTGAVCIDLDNAIREMVASQPDLMLYEAALDAMMVRLPRGTEALVLSMEQKSPYAYADASVARKHRYLCFHLMEVDQSTRPLPLPVFGDLFIANTRETAARLKASWAAHHDRVTYLGPLRSWATVDEREAAGLGRNGTWCFFTSAEPKNDLRVLHQLAGLARRSRLRFIVKLHPRDTMLNYRHFRGVRFIKDGDMSKRELFQMVDYGLSFGSAVISDLFCYGKPFLFLDISDDPFFNESVHHGKYARLTIHSVDDLERGVADIDTLVRHYRVHRERYLADIGGSSTPAELAGQLLDAARRLRPAREGGPRQPHAAPDLPPGSDGPS